MAFQIKGIIPLKTVCVQHKNVTRLVFCVLLKEKKKSIWNMLSLGLLLYHHMRLDSVFPLGKPLFLQ